MEGEVEEGAYWWGHMFVTFQKTVIANLPTYLPTFRPTCLFVYSFIFKTEFLCVARAVLELAL